ncbi:MAG: hypothetical protein XD98_0045 [Microgenomates bacterium 39_6]|nr:MAG: hypothetical protein XD98_0045 [Microgenomates bacterium 39_6]
MKHLNLKSLEKRAIEEIRPDQDLILLSIFSALIASFGVKANNIYLIIGSMLVAPFIDPIVSLVVLARSGNFKKVFKAVGSLFLVIGAVFVTSFIFWLLNLAHLDLNQINPPPEALLIDNFFVALIIGIISALLWFWPKSSDTSAGIAVAISLVPPISYATFYLIAQDMVNFTGQINNFVINFLGIILGAELAMFFYAKSGRKNSL